MSIKFTTFNCNNTNLQTSVQLCHPGNWWRRSGKKTNAIYVFAWISRTYIYKGIFIYITSQHQPKKKREKNSQKSLWQIESVMFFFLSFQISERFLDCHWLISELRSSKIAINSTLTLIDAFALQTAHEDKGFISLEERISLAQRKIASNTN